MIIHFVKQEGVPIASKSSFYSKMVLFGCFISIIPLVALGFFSFMKSSTSVQNHVNSEYPDYESNEQQSRTGRGLWIIH